MKKLSFLVLFIISVLSVVLIILSIKSKNILKENVITINRAYFYKVDTIDIKLYSDESASFLLLKDDYELYLTNDISTIKTTVNEVVLEDVLMYKNKVYYEYNLKLCLNTEKINLEDVKLELRTNEYLFSIKIGNIYYYEEFASFNAFSVLYGLSYNDGFKTIAGVILKPTEANKQLTISIPNYEFLRLVNIEENEEYVSIEKYVSDYKYKQNESYHLVTEDKTVLAYMDYQDKLYFDMFPLYVICDNETYLIKNFKYLEIHNLEDVEVLLNVGDYDV